MITAGGSQAIALVGDHLRAAGSKSRTSRSTAATCPASRWALPAGAPTPTPPVGWPRGDDRVAVWDEAFLPLSAGTWTRGRPGWGLGSLTKAFACPGLRLGFAVAPDERAAAAVRHRRPAWAVGSLGCAVLPELLARADPAEWTANRGRSRRTDAGAQGPRADAPAVRRPWVLAAAAPEGLRAALARHAVVVRDCRSFGLPDRARRRPGRLGARAAGRGVGPGQGRRRS